MSVIQRPITIVTSLWTPSATQRPPTPPFTTQGTSSRCGGSGRPEAVQRLSRGCCVGVQQSQYGASSKNRNSLKDTRQRSPHEAGSRVAGTVSKQATPCHGLRLLWPPCLVLCAGTTTYEWYPRDLLLGLAGDLPRSLNHHFKTVYKPRCWLLKTSTDGNETGHSMT